MNNLEYILDFTVSLGCKMLRVGANLERVNDTMYRICRSYHLNSISIVSFKNAVYENGSGWYEGKAKQEITITMNEQINTEE